MGPLNMRSFADRPKPAPEGHHPANIRNRLHPPRGKVSGLEDWIDVRTVLAI